MGRNQLGKPLFTYPRKRNDKGVYLTLLGTDRWKDTVSGRLRLLEPGEGYIHYPVNDLFDEDFFRHLTNERQIMKVDQGKRRLVWDDGGRRNEPFDLEGYNLAGIRILKAHRGVNLDNYPKITSLIEAESTPAKRISKKTNKTQKQSTEWLNI